MTIRHFIRRRCSKVLFRPRVFIAMHSQPGGHGSACTGTLIVEAQGICGTEIDGGHVG